MYLGQAWVEAVTPEIATISRFDRIEANSSLQRRLWAIRGGNATVAP
jgi:hypothetical protein